jgi:hypothetical protein
MCYDIIDDMWIDIVGKVVLEGTLLPIDDEVSIHIGHRIGEYTPSEKEWEYIDYGAPEIIEDTTPV